jgi:hypothetical protein
MTGAPERRYYFRVRPGGAMLLRIDHDPRLRRSRMSRVAGIDLSARAVLPSDAPNLTDEEAALIRDWLDKGNGLSGKGAEAVAQIGHIAHWAHFIARPDELAQATEELLLAMQDLREVLVNKAAQRARADQE